MRTTPYFLILAQHHRGFAALPPHVSMDATAAVRAVKSKRDDKAIFLKCSSRPMLEAALAEAKLDLEIRKVKSGFAATVTPTDLFFGEWDVLNGAVRNMGPRVHLAPIDACVVLMMRPWS